MNREQSYNLIRQTFTQGFEKTRFRNFAINLLNRIDESKAKTWNSMYIKDAFKNHVSHYERLGTYTSPDNDKLDILIVHLTGITKLSRARTAIRNFVAHHLKTRDEKDAALVAFVSPTENQWRFSYIKMEYATVEKESGKVGVETRLTPARRFSYIVGEGESCHTAQTRFLPLLQDTKTYPNLADIEEVFSVEAVTKEFFKRYVELFENIHQALEKLIKKDKSIGNEFQSRKVNPVDFAKKLMGQIVFLYFLQKKGWLGVKKEKDWGTGPHDFLRRLAQGEYGAYANYFNDILEPLFYDTLANDRGHEAWCKNFKCRIPFLNGGLFEALGGYEWRKIDILLPNRLFTNNDPVEEGITGTGVLDVFDRYNFTVNEAEPLEKEVAIDPEMLGKVFENLIEENLRKGLGAYYTPREIVHYMCQESLINHIDTAINKEMELVSRKDIDTFIHLGEQYSFYEAAKKAGTIGKDYPKPSKSIAEHAKIIDEKLVEITICDPAVGSGAFPVGMMTEIVRARSALTPYFNDVHERTPYFFKRHAIQNCLYGVDIDAGAVEIAKLRLWLSLVVDEEDVRQIKPLPNLDYKVMAGNSLLGFPFKSQRLAKIEQLKQEFFCETDYGEKAKLKSEIDRQLHEAFAASKNSLGYGVDFDFEICFSEVFRRKGGFDIVIANPPYIDSESMSKTADDLRKTIQASYSMTKGNWDIYIAFFEKGFNLLNNIGVLSYITPDKWISKPFGDEMRRQTNKKISCILKAGREVFESVNVDAIVSVFTNSLPQSLAIYDFIGTKIQLKRIIDKDSLKQPYAYDWLFSEHVELLAKIETQRATLDQLGLCENACATSDAYKLQEFIENEPIKVDKHKYLRIINTGTIGKYISKWGKREIVYLGSKYIRPAVEKAIFVREFKNTYGKKAVKPKIIVKGLNLLDACIDADGTVIPGKTTLMISSNSHVRGGLNEIEVLKLLLSVINSSIAFFYLREKYPASSYNKGTTFTKEMINKLLIPNIQHDDQKKLVHIVDKIIEAKQLNPDSDTITLECKINEIFYRLYGLSEGEIAIIEGR
jgi:hypothetical protein